MTRYLISFDGGAMDHIAKEHMPAVGKAADEVVQEALERHRRPAEMSEPSSLPDGKGKPSLRLGRRAVVVQLARCAGWPGT